MTDDEAAQLAQTVAELQRGLHIARLELKAVKFAGLKDTLDSLTSIVQLQDKLVRAGLVKVARAEAAERKVRAVEMLHVWTNEDGKRFIFADDLAAALEIPSA